MPSDLVTKCHRMSPLGHTFHHRDACHADEPVEVRLRREWGRAGTGLTPVTTLEPDHRHTETVGNLDIMLTLGGARQSGPTENGPLHLPQQRQPSCMPTHIDPKSFHSMKSSSLDSFQHLMTYVNTSRLSTLTMPYACTSPEAMPCHSSLMEVLQISSLNTYIPNPPLLSKRSSGPNLALQHHGLLLDTRSLMDF